MSLDVNNGNFRTIIRGEYYNNKYNQYTAEKRIIAQYVVEKYIKDNASVILDAGSTIEIVAEEMFKKRKTLTVLTNNMGVYTAYIASLTSEANDEKGFGIESSNFNNTSKRALYSPNGNELLLSGGRYVGVYDSLLGSWALESVQKFQPSVIIIGTSGITDEIGICCHGSEESDYKRALATKTTSTLIIVTDFTKFGKYDSFSFAKISELCMKAEEVIIVTNEPSQEDHNSKHDECEKFTKEINRIMALKLPKLKIERVN